jgi:DNA-binding response OmpR family regulator
MIEKESDRKDQTSKLGKPLSMGEIQMYRLIHSAGTVPVTIDELYKQYYGLEIGYSDDRRSVYAKIRRIRQKLGEHSIIGIKKTWHKKGGYLSKRALIEEKFPKLKRSLTERKSDRKDQTPRLGKPLTWGEERMYALIHSAGAVPITVDELYKQYYGREIENIGDRMPVYQTIDRIKQKLGEHSIINLKRPRHKKGYISRRALIEEKFPNLKPSS